MCHAIEQASRRWRGDRRDDSARTRGKILISARLLASELVEGTRAAPKHAAAVIAARAPTTDVERLEEICKLVVANF